MEMNKNTEPLYPILQSDSIPNQEKISFRLNKITDIQNLLENNIRDRRSLNKKYSKASKVLNAMEISLTTASIGMGSVGIGLFVTVVAAPIALGLEVTAIVTGGSSILCKLINKKLIKKAQKHKEIKILSEAKLNTILDLISKAISDNKISDEEFSLILNEFVKFQDMKERIISKQNNIKIVKTKSESDPPMNKLFEEFRLNIDNIQLLLNKKQQRKN